MHSRSRRRRAAPARDPRLRPFSTAVPEYADYNTADVAIEGTVDMATGTIDVQGRALTAAAA